MQNIFNRIARHVFVLRFPNCQRMLWLKLTLLLAEAAASLFVPDGISHPDFFMKKRRKKTDYDVHSLFCHCLQGKDFLTDFFELLFIRDILYADFVKTDIETAGIEASFYLSNTLTAPAVRTKGKRLSVFRGKSF